MTPQMNDVLHGLIKASGDTDEVLCFACNSTLIQLDHNPVHSYDCKRHRMEIDAIIDQLVSKGYVVRFTRDHFSLTHKGLHPRRFLWEDFKFFMFRSILTPILVSIITTILTAIVLRLLGWSP